MVQKFMMSIRKEGGEVLKFITCLQNLLFLSSRSIVLLFIFKDGGVWVGGIYFSFSFCSDFNLEATVVKTDKIRGLKHLFTPFSLNWETIFFFKIINNYGIAHQKNNVKNNNDRTFD